MIVWLIVHWISNGCWSHFWCFFDTFTIRTCNLLNHQKPLFFQWISMILPFRETWFFMIFLIFFDTSFGIDFLWVLASILVPFWKPFVIKFNVSGWSFYVRFLGLECYWFWQKKHPGNSPRNLSFCLFVRPCCAGWIFDASLAQLGSLLGPFWSPVGSILLVWNIYFDNFDFYFIEY